MNNLIFNRQNCLQIQVVIRKLNVNLQNCPREHMCVRPCVTCKILQHDVIIETYNKGPHPIIIHPRTSTLYVTVFL